MKKKYIAIITTLYELESHLLHYESFYKKLSSSFEKIYLINSMNLRYFPKYAKKIYFEKDFDIKKNYERLPKNFILFDPKNEKDFSEFVKDKQLLVINNFGKHFWSLKIYRLLKKHRIKQVQISYFGVFGGSGRIFQINNFINFLKFFIFQTIFNKLTVLFSSLGFVPKLEIRFLSNKDHILNIKKNFLSNFLYKNKLLFAKKIQLVNSRSYDIFLNNKLPITEDYIVHLDASLNYKEEIELRGKLDENKIINHYYHLEKFLSKLSKSYNKTVKVCIHPLYDLEEHKKYLKNFEVLKFVTRDYIYKSFLVTCFDSSAITDAILLKKRIIGLESSFMTKNEILHSRTYPQRVGYIQMNTQKNYNFDPKKLLNEIDSKIKNYDDFISRYHCFEKNKEGADQIIKTIKENFF